MAVDAPIDTKRGLLNRAEELRETEPNFARFVLAMVNATEADDLEATSPEIVETMLRKTYTRLGKREGKSHVVFDFAPESAGQNELIV